MLLSLTIAYRSLDRDLLEREMDEYAARRMHNTIEGIHCRETYLGDNPMLRVPIYTLSQAVSRAFPQQIRSRCVIDEFGSTLSPGLVDQRT